MGKIIPFEPNSNERAISKPKRKPNTKHTPINGMIIRWYVRSDGNIAQDSFVHILAGTYQRFGTTETTFAAHDLFETEIEARRAAESYLTQSIGILAATLAVHRKRIHVLEKLNG